ncbi:unnamed protein product [Toxocara canis]|uniref:XRN_N domain-containing protein n=1 Tax=Toxocara canis TaxID=6265 RepID=A0A183U634_TOXCA|nr:unnamed protein product [Toxocara canis]
MDEWSLMSEVDILPKLPAQFNEWLESKKWTERRDALQAVLDELTKSPRLDPKANYGELTNTLRNVCFVVYVDVYGNCAHSHKISEINQQ